MNDIVERLHDPMDRDAISDAIEEINTLRDAKERLEKHVEVLQDKDDSNCACGHDNGGDICLFHFRMIDRSKVKCTRELFAAKEEIERLKQVVIDLKVRGWNFGPDSDHEKLKALTRDVRSVLEPFAQEADEYVDEADDDCFLTGSVNLRDMRAAKALLDKLKETKE